MRPLLLKYSYRVVMVEGVRPDVKLTLEGWRATQSHSSTDMATMEKLQNEIDLQPSRPHIASTGRKEGR